MRLVHRIGSWEDSKIGSRCQQATRNDKDLHHWAWDVVLALQPIQLLDSHGATLAVIIVEHLVRLLSEAGCLS